MDIQVGKKCQSRSFPNIVREVVHLNKLGIVTYRSIQVDKPHPEFSALMQMVDAEFVKCSTGEVRP